VIVDRYYYNQLNKREKEIYKAFYDGLMAHKDIIPVSKRADVSQEMLSRVYEAITLDNPLIYYVNQSVVNVAQDEKGNVALIPQYFFPEGKVKEYNKKIQNVVNHLAAKLQLTEGSDYEKELRVHDFICNNIFYDYEGADKSKTVNIIASHGILGVFAYHKAQCEGIAKAVKVLLNAVDVKCIVVTGKAINEKEQTCNHAWNIVKINNSPYHLDVTWDLGASRKNAVAYDYFNLNDSQIRVNHDISARLPKCGSEKYNFFRMNQLIFTNKLSLKRYLEKGIKEGKRDFYFRAEGSLVPKEIIEEMAAFGGHLMPEQSRKIKCMRIVNFKMRTCRMLYY
jgi:uncharacterized membrane-anchored protein